MTGWRVGWLVTRADLGSKLAQLNEFFVSHAATFAQVAAQTALPDGEDELRAHGREPPVEPGLLRRRASRAARRRRCRSPEAPSTSSRGSTASTTRWRSAGGCSSSSASDSRPGSAFGAGGEGSVRICYAAERSVLEPALERLARFL